MNRGILGRFSAFRSPRAGAMAPVVAATDLGNGEAELVLYGNIVENEPVDWWTGEPTGELCISLQRVLDEVAKLAGAERITVKLNSAGGELYAGLAIHTALRKLGAKVTVLIDGLAASAASVIACAGDEVVAYPWSIMMVHRCSALLFGWYNAADMETASGQMRASDKSMVNIYAGKTGRSEAELESELDAETWMTGSEIVDAGYADTYDDAQPDDGGRAVFDADARTLLVAGIRHDVSAFAHAAEAVSKRPKAPKATGAEAITVEEPPEAAATEGDPMENVEELQAAYPELVAQLQQQAAADERERIRGIDGIEASVGAEAAARAKYDEPMTAAELALESMRADASRGERFLDAIAADAEASNADGIEPAPAADDAAEGDEAGSIMAAAAKIVNARLGKEN